MPALAHDFTEMVGQREQNSLNPPYQNHTIKPASGSPMHAAFDSPYPGDQEVLTKLERPIRELQALPVASHGGIR